MKNKIIKLLTLILSVAVVVAFTACGAKEEDKKDEASKYLDGSYFAKAELKSGTKISNMFRLADADKGKVKLQVAKGKYKVTVRLSGKGYDALFLGEPKDAAKAKKDELIKAVKDDKGYMTYTFKLDDLDKEIKLASRSAKHAKAAKNAELKEVNKDGSYGTTASNIVWYPRTIKVSSKGLTTTTIKDLEGMEEAKAVETVKKQKSPALTDNLIKAIYVQERNDNTDKMCKVAKASWDALSKMEKEEVEEADYYGLNTGDAKKDAPLNAAPKKDKELLVVSFGTSFNGSRAATIGGIEKTLAKAYPKYDVRRAFTAQIIINHIQSRDGIKINNVEQAIKKATDAKVKEMIVQPTHLMHGAEYDELKKVIEEKKGDIKVKYAEPLLGEASKDEKKINADKTKVMKLLAKEAAKDDGAADIKSADSKTAYVFMGHGTAHEAKVSYTQMQTVADKLGYKNVFVGTVEGEPESTSVKEIINKVKKAGYKTVVLRPMMVVAGDHANNDMAGDDDDSWKMEFKKAGFTVKTQIKGLGQIPGIQKIYVDHTKAAMK